MSRRDRDLAVSAFAQSRGPRLRRTAFLIVGDWHTAEDMVQATLVKVYVRWSRLPVDAIDAIDAYVHRMLVNECLSHLRRHRRERLTDEVPEPAAVDGLDESAGSLVMAVQQLPPQQRAVVALRFLEDLPVAVVASTLGIAEGTVKSQTARALLRLRGHLTTERSGEENECPTT